MVHLIVLPQIGENGGLLFIIPCGHHESQHIGGGKIVADHVFGDLCLVLHRRFQRAFPVGIRTLLAERKSDHNGDHKQNRHNKAGLISKLAHKRDLGHEIAVFGPVHQRPEQHQKARHDNKHGQQRKQNGFDQANGHIRANAELHEHHSHQAAHRCQAAGSNFRNGFAQRNDDGLPNGKGLMLLLIAVAENHRIIQRQR